MNDDLTPVDAGNSSEAVWPPAPATMPSVPPDPVFEFRPQSVWLMLLLSVITLWTYPYYWACKQAKIVNRITPSKPVLLPIFVIIGVLTLAVQVANIFWPDDNSNLLRDLSFLCSLAALWCEFYLAFGLNRAFRVNSRSDQYFHRIWTFLFGFFYLQYRINKNLRIRKAEGAHLPQY